MSNRNPKRTWATIAQLRALPKQPSQMADMKPGKITEKIQRMKHKEKVRGVKYKYACGT
jgi:hypothetical protein